MNRRRTAPKVAPKPPIALGAMVVSPLCTCRRVVLVLDNGVFICATCARVAITSFRRAS